MITRAVFIIFAIQTTTCYKASKQLETLVPKTMERCKSIKCSPVEDPRCVKVVHRGHNNTIYIIAVNKCEIQYMECHQDYEAKIVPMKQCGHEDIKTKLKMKKIAEAEMEKARIKRDAPHGIGKPLRDRRFRSLKLTKAEPRSQDEDDVAKLHSGGRRRIAVHYTDYSEYEDEGGHKVFISRNIKTKGSKKEHWPQSELPVRGYIHGPVEGPEHGSQGKGGHVVRLEDVYDEVRLVASKFTTEFELYYIAGYRVNQYNIYDDSELWPGDKQLLNTKDVESVEVPHIPGIEPETDFPLISKEYYNFKNKPTEHPAKHSVGNCPETCPAHSVMVCGKCIHGVYKSFVSVCHMKRFSCDYPEEAIQLISRNPCIMSAPFLSDDTITPRSHLSEPNDDDQILKFIKCKELGRLKGDPICLV